MTAANRGAVPSHAGKFVAEYFYRIVKKPASRAKQGASQPPVPRGVSTAGRIVKLMVGQGHGYIGLTDEREVFFHRRDVRDGVSFNDLAVNDYVTFELLEDDISGARALRVARRRG